MATVAAPRRAVRAPDRRVLDWLQGLPGPITAGALLLVLLAASAFIRTRYISGQFWMDEGLSVGISSHSLSAIPGVLRHDGSPPLYYVLLHFWMRVFGSSESATHALSLVFGLLTIPVGMWAGWSLFGRRAGLMAAVLFAFSSFLTEYSQETRMYALMGFLGLVAAAAFVHGFVYRRRRYLILFAFAQALMLYTHAWGIFFGAGAVLALIPVYLASDDRRLIVRDAVLTFAGAAVLFLPWLPNFIYQARHTAAPWDSAPRFGAPVQLSRDLLGGDRVSVALLIPAVIGFTQLFRGGADEATGRRFARMRARTAMWTLIVLPASTLALAWLASQITPAWVSRYFAPILGATLLLAAFGCSRAGIVGIVAVALCVVFLAKPASFTPQYKSDMRDVSGEMTPLLHRGDLVIVGQPEQVPLTWYYLPGGLRYASTIGAVSDPRFMNWVDALGRLRRASPSATLLALIARLRVGQQVLFVRPMTEGARGWKAPWTQLVRRRSAQWGALLAGLPSLRPVAWAPHNYRGACCVPNSALLYRKVS